MKKILLILFIIFSVTIYSNITLQDILENYKKNSFEYKEKLIERDKNNKAFIKALSYYLPNISFYISADSTTLTGTSYSHGITASMTLLNIPYLFTMGMSKEQSDIYNLMFIKNNFEIILKIIENYFSLLDFQEKIRLYDIILSNQKKILDKSKFLYEKNIISNIDYLNIKAYYNTLKYNLNNSISQYNNLKTEFQILTGLKIDTLLTLIDTIPYFDTMLINEEYIIKNSIDYKLAKKNYNIKSLNKFVSLFNFAPTISASANFGISDTILDINYNNFTNNYSFSGNIKLSFPIFTGFSRTVDLIEASQDKKIAQIGFKKTEMQIKTQIENLKSDIDIAKSLLNSAKLNYTSQKLIFEKSEYLLINGQLSSTEYINILNNYSNAYSNYINSQKNIYTIYYTYLYYLRRI